MMEEDDPFVLKRNSHNSLIGEAADPRVKRRSVTDNAVQSVIDSTERVPQLRRVVIRVLDRAGSATSVIEGPGRGDET